MSVVQDLQGIKVLPSPALRDGDFNGRSFFKKNPNQWPKGFAFGGWIYDAQVSLGFSKRPTQLTLNIVLENDTSINEVQQFDINDRLLQVSLVTTKQHPNGGVTTSANFDTEFWEGHYYSIFLHGVKFNRMYLYDYSISVDAGQKTLMVSFKDYSVILDKIYVGLTKRQGPARIPSLSPDQTGGVYKPWPLCGPDGKYYKRDWLIKDAQATTSLTTYCPNCYMMGDGFNSKNNTQQSITSQYGGNLEGFYNKVTGSITRKTDLSSFMGRPNPRAPLVAQHFDNMPQVRKEGCLDGSNKNRVACFASNNLWGPIYYNYSYFWNHLDTAVNVGGQKNQMGLTIDGGYIMLGTEEFQEKTCGSAPEISYNFSELLNSLKYRGIQFYNTDGTVGRYSGGNQASSNPTWPDKNPRFRANYIGTLREVLEQWCGVFGLDYFYQDMANHSDQGFHFLDLQAGADIGPIKDIVDPSTALGKEFGSTEDQKSVIISYKESSTLENTYIQSCITSNIKPFSVKERKKSIKRYIPMLPLHPCDFSIPNHEQQKQVSLLGETYKYHKIANFIPWNPNPQHDWFNHSLGDSYPSDWDHRKRVWQRTNRELWDMDISMALVRLNQELRDMHVANRICENALSELCPCAVYPQGWKYNKDTGPGNAGDIIKYVCNGDGSPSATIATEAQLRTPRFKSVGKRIGHDPSKPNSKPNLTQEKDLKANFEALGFQELMEIEDYMVKENLIASFMRKQDIEDVSLDISHFKMFVGYYDEVTHQQHVAWETRCAEKMYGFGAVFGGTLPGEPFIPTDYYGVRDGNLGFGEDSCGVSIPKLNNSFSPDAAQYPQLGSNLSLEALDAPFNGLLINSGNYLPTGLYIAPIDNPWGSSKEDFDKAFWRKFQDNACKEFNNSLNIIEDAGFNLEPEVDDQGKVVRMKKANDQFPFKKQDWQLATFTPKFFKNSEQILDSADAVIQALYDDERLVDEVSHNRHSIEYGSQRYCQKLTIMIITDTRPGKHPNIEFTAKYNDRGGWNPQAKRQRQLWEIAEAKRKARDDIRNRCDRDLIYEFCENAISNGPDFPIRNNAVAGDWGQINKVACAIDPTGVYKEGFAKDLVGGYLNKDGSTNWGKPNSRVLNLTIKRNPNTRGFIPTSEDGEYHLMDLEQDMEQLEPTVLTYPLIYPINNFKLIDESSDGSWTTQSILDGARNDIANQFYSGIWTASQTLEDRMPELIEVYGEPPASHNPTAGIRVVNNTIDPDLGAMIDPERGGFMTKMYDSHGQEIQSIEQYHNYVAYGYAYNPAARATYAPTARGLNDYSVIEPNKKIDLRLAGSLGDFPTFLAYCKPQYGLQDLSISFSDQGVTTSLSFADRPAQQPNMEGILNKIGPRTM